MAQIRLVEDLLDVQRCKAGMRIEPGRCDIRAVAESVMESLQPAPAAKKLHWVQENDDVVITVEDSGQAIPSDFLPHVFEPFRQLDMSSTRRHGGLGLGLTIVKNIVDAHGGTVAAHSEGAGRPSAPHAPGESGGNGREKVA